MGVTLKTIAKQAGVSLPTASSILNGRGRDLRYKELTQRAVFEAAEELGYTANPLARGLLGKSTKTVGIAWSLGRPHASKIVQDLSFRLWKRGYVSFMVNALSDQGATRAILSDLLRRRVDGVILQASHGRLDNLEICEQLKQFRAAVAVVDASRASPVDMVVHDVSHGIKQLMDYWLATGRRRIGFIGHELSNQEKIEPLQEKLRAFGLPDKDVVIGSESVLPLTNHFDLFWAALESRFGSRSDRFPFDALLCASDAGAGAVITWLHHRGLRVPEDVAVAGMEDVDLARAIRPPLASMERHYEKLAEVIDDMLFRRLERPKEPARVEVVPSTFVWRESAGERERSGVGTKDGF